MKEYTLIELLMITFAISFILAMITVAIAATYTNMKNDGAPVYYMRCIDGVLYFDNLSVKFNRDSMVELCE